VKAAASLEVPGRSRAGRCLKLGGLVLSFDDPSGPEPSPWPYANFESPPAEPDARFKIFRSLPPKFPGAKLLHRSSDYWEIHRWRDRWLIDTSLEADSDFIRKAVIDLDWKSGEIYVIANPIGDWERGPARAFSYPLDQLILASLLAGQGALMVHACGVVDQGRGYVFMGRSGAGKSTTATLWHKAGATVLSDDRVVLRRQGGCWRVHGAPWYSRARLCSPASAPLEGLFTLAHGKANSLEPIKDSRAALELMSHCVVPVWDPERRLRVFDAAASLVEAAPLRRYYFRLATSAVNFIRGL
jgi:hypothetical protein